MHVKLCVRVSLEITLAQHMNTNPIEAGKARRVIDEVLADHKNGA